MLVAAAAPFSAAVLSWRRAGFAPLGLREEGLALVMVLGLLAAMLPGMVSGWQSARVLNSGGQSSATRALGAWVIAAGIASLASGASYAAWRRR